MIRFLAVLLINLLPHAASADMPIRQVSSTTQTPIHAIYDVWTEAMPAEVTLAATDAEAKLSYAGEDMPVSLRTFLKVAFPTLDIKALAPGNPVSLSLTLRAQGNGTLMHLVAQAPFVLAPRNYPTGAHVVLDGIAGTCSGQTVLSHPAPVASLADTYRHFLQDAGFALQNDSPQEVSFFIGYRPGCSAFLYLSEDTPETSLIVLRYLED